VAREFLAWLDVPPGGRWLEVGSGTGALTQTILDTAAPQRRSRPRPLAGLCGLPRGRMCRTAAPALRPAMPRTWPFQPGAFEAAVSGLVLNFVPQPERMLAGMARAVRPGGVVALLRVGLCRPDATTALFLGRGGGAGPAAGRGWTKGPRFPLCQPQPLAKLFRAAGLEQVETLAIDIPTVFRDFDDYWQPFLGGRAPRPAMCCR